MTRIVTPPAAQELPAEDPFRFGWKYELRQSPDGRDEWEQVPLTLDEVLHPEEGFCIPENTYQERSCNYLSGVFRFRLAGEPDALVLNDCLVNWGVAGLRNHSPDLSVFRGVRDRWRTFSIFSVKAEGAKPLLCLEVVSADNKKPQARDNDAVIKVQHYHQAGVPWYYLVDQEEEDGPRTLIGYRHDPSGYVRLPLDEQGRLFLEPIGVWLALGTERVICYDATTGAEIGDYAQVAQELKEAEAKAQAAEAKLQALQAELQRLRSDGANEPPKS